MMEGLCSTFQGVGNPHVRGKRARVCGIIHLPGYYKEGGIEVDYEVAH